MKTALILVMLGLIIGITGCDASPDAGAEAGADIPRTALVSPDGDYPKQPLAKDKVVVKVIQSKVKNLQDFDDVAVGLKANLALMEEQVERSCESGLAPDFLLFNEFPLTGYSSGLRQEKLKFTIRIPGPETDRLGAAAKACNTYIIFGSYARDDDWPGHILSINTVIDKNGEIAAKFWKTRSVKRLSDQGEIPTTTIENVRDRYRAEFGIDAEFPVLRTEYGNIAVSTVQLDPFVYAAFAMKGVEIMFRTATMFSKEDVLAIARFNKFYSAMSNIVFEEDSPVAKSGGKSLIVAPNGEILSELKGNVEGIIEAEIPIASFREGRRIPNYPMEIVAPVLEQYVQEVPLNHLDLPEDQLPKTREEMKQLLDENSRWLTD